MLFPIGLRRSVSMLFLVSAAIVGCSSPKPDVRTSSSNAAGIARHKSFSVEVSDTPPPGYSPAARSKNVMDMARPKVEAELARKGYVAATGAESDLIVRLSAGVRTVVDQPSGRVAIEGAPADLDEVSTLAVTIIDRKSSESLFSGTAKKEIHRTTVKESDVAYAVTQILEPVPAADDAR